MEAVSVEYGAETRKKYFQLDPTDTFLNHGSYGSCPTQVLNRQKRYIDEYERNPDHWWRRTSVKYWTESLKTVASFVGGKFENCVLTVNTTTAINHVLKSIPLAPGESILYASTTYQPFRNTCTDAANRNQGAGVVCIDITFPIQSKEDILQKYREIFNEHSNIRVAVIDVITSPSSVVMPFAELVALCRERGVLSVVDGAHAPGQLPLNLEQLNADFFAGNFHKWVFSPKTCAVLWVNPIHHAIIKPVVTSRFYFEKPFQKSFFDQGTRDITAQICAKDGIQFFKEMGGLESIYRYNKALLDKGVALLVSSWGTERFPIPADMEAPFIRLIKAPTLAGYETTHEGAKRLYADIYYRHKVVTLVVLIQGELWFRLSAQIYNQLQDYQQLDEIITRMLREA